ncbi:MAG: ACP S-malonyltransferase [Gammaproteobacteria bacterium]|nr:ACP S-malonyltransferase [Gammaproteobacteria bacterium]
MSNQQKNFAFVFPGQGSQAIGMLNEIAGQYTEVKQTFDRASSVVGKDLWQLVTEGPEADLNQTENTQPVMLAAGVAMWELWCKLSSVRPAWMAGHSLGEYTALVCSGALAFEDGIRLVSERARLMQAAVPAGVGAMAAILGLDDDQVIAICAAGAADNEIVSAVNFNAPGQVVIAGHKAAVERAAEAAKAAGAKRAVLLSVSVPSHCALMQPAAEQLAASLQNITINSPNVGLIHNVDVEAHSTAEAIRGALTEQLYKPVRWVETINYLNNQGVNRFVECGPGKVLMALNKRIAKEAEHWAIYDSATLTQAVEQLND